MEGKTSFEYLVLEPTRGCNLRCRMCNTTSCNPSAKYLDLDRVDWSFLANKIVEIGAIYEPTIHPEFNKLIDKLNQLGCSIIFITNGHNLHKKNFPALFDANLLNVTFSFDGISQSSYEEIRVGGDYHQTLENICSFRETFSATDTWFAINYTMLQRNLSEVGEAPDFWNARGFDVVRFIGMVVREPDEYVFRNNLWDVRGDMYAQLECAADAIRSQNLKITAMNPYYDEKYSARNGVVCSENPNAVWPENVRKRYMYGDGYGGPLPCKCPFESARITWDGLVYLCNSMPVGSIYKKSFEDIWQGRASEDIREKVLNDPSMCKKCDYFRFCIASQKIDTSDIRNYYSLEMRRMIEERMRGQH